MKKCYPDYTGRKFFVEIKDKPFDVTSYWDGGSRDYYTFIRADGRQMNLPESAPWKQVNENRMAQLTPGLACVRHSIFCGHDCGLTLFLHSSDMPKQLLEKMEDESTSAYARHICGTVID